MSNDIEQAAQKAKELLAEAVKEQKAVLASAVLEAKTVIADAVKEVASTELSPKIILAIQDAVQKERDRADKSYAIKLVERILFSILALFGVSTATYFINLFLKK